MVQKTEAVRDLKQMDFQIFEDGWKQDIATFNLVDVPAPDPKKAALEPAAGTVAAFFWGDRLF